MRIPAWMYPSKPMRAPSIRGALLAALAVSCLCGSAHADDGDDSSAKAAPAIPNLYLDLRTNYGTVPAGALSLGFGNTSLVTTLQTLQQLTPGNALPTLPTGVTSPASQSIFVDL